MYHCVVHISGFKIPLTGVCFSSNLGCHPDTDWVNF